VISVTELVGQAIKEGITLRLVGNRLRCRLPKAAGARIWALVDELRRHRDEVIELLTARPLGITVTNVLRIFGGGKVLPFPTRPTAELVVNYPESYPPSVELAEAVTIADVPKFAQATVDELQRFVAAANAGRNEVLSKFHLIAEKIEHLALCGVQVELDGIDYSEPEPRPVTEKDLERWFPESDEKATWQCVTCGRRAAFMISWQCNRAEECDFIKRRESQLPKEPSFSPSDFGLTDAEVRELFAEYGLDIDDRTGLPENILTWLKRCDEIQARTKAMRENPEYCRQLAREYESPKAPVVLPWTPSERELKKMKALCKRGAVFCRGCYRRMQLSIVNGGFDWHCEDCKLVWRYHYGGERWNDTVSKT